jgi:hypothetical protein
MTCIIITDYFICHSSTHPFSPVFIHFQRQHLVTFRSGIRIRHILITLGRLKAWGNSDKFLNYIYGYTMIHICISVLYMGSVWYTYNYAYLLACCEWWIVRLPINNNLYTLLKINPRNKHLPKPKSI